MIMSQHFLCPKTCLSVTVSSNEADTSVSKNSVERTLWIG